MHKLKCLCVHALTHKILKRKLLNAHSNISYLEFTLECSPCITVANLKFVATREWQRHNSLICLQVRMSFAMINDKM